MTKPSLDQVEISILEPRMCLNRSKWFAAAQGSPEREKYEADIKKDQQRYHELTGRWFDYRYTMPVVAGGMHQ